MHIVMQESYATDPQCITLRYPGVPTPLMYYIQKKSPCTEYHTRERCSVRPYLTADIPGVG